MNRTIEAACACHIGRVRSNNEDNFYFNGICLPSENSGQPEPLTLCTSEQKDLCFAVFDGMGGGAYGEIASFTAAEQLRIALEQTPHPEEITGFLTEISEKMNHCVYEESAERRVGEMGSTQAILYLRDDRIHVCNIGDSRIFGLRGSSFLQISRDDSDEAFMLQHGITGRKPHLTQYLGMNPAEIHIAPHIVSDAVRQGDVYLICSDGVTDMVSNDKLQAILSGEDKAETCVRRIVEAALDGGGKDNITAAVIRVTVQDSTAETTQDERNDPHTEPQEDSAVSWLRRLWKRL